MCWLICRENAYLGYLVAAGALCCLCTAGYAAVSSPLGPQALAPLQPMLLAFAAAVPATQTLIMAKSASMMLVHTLARSNQLGSWFFWVAVAVTVAASLLWTAALSHGIARFPTIVVVPIMQVRAPHTWSCVCPGVPASTTDANPSIRNPNSSSRSKTQSSGCRWRTRWRASSAARSSFGSSGT